MKRTIAAAQCGTGPANTAVGVEAKGRLIAASLP